MGQNNMFEMYQHTYKRYYLIVGDSNGDIFT